MLQIREVFRDHLEECLAHFSRRFREKMPPGTKGIYDSLRPMAEFCGVEIGSVQKGWLSEEPNAPVGVNRFRVMCYLSLHGYKIIEFERLPMTLKGIVELIGFSVLSAKTITDRLGYSETQSIYDVLNQVRGISDKVQNELRKIWKEKRDELDQRKRQCFEKLRLVILTEDTKEKPVQLLLADSEAGKGHLPLNTALSVMQGLAGLMDMGIFENLSPENQAELERNTTMILGLSARLSVLGSKIISAKKE